MRIEGLGEIAMNFDAMLIDQFGVIHDGQKLYPHAADVLARLHGLEIPVVVMTNSGKRSAANRERIIRMGIPRAHFVEAASSGEVGQGLIAGKSIFIVGQDGQDYGFESVTISRTTDGADIIVIAGSNAPHTSLDEYRAIFERLRTPAICCNPDKLMLTRHGLLPGPGAIAQIYADMGGQVTWAGKPYRAIYDHALALLGNPKRILCIGDSAEHDVAGGRGAGLSTLLTLTGVSQGLDIATLSPQPDYVMDAFKW
ncbi:MAG: TIGR01459 family HAD-type hydrolase [Rhizobiales bacterium]|nr:TIGR01459 family HAD-type hydrolase [Hyphomicrobiales bacterium]